MMRCALFLVLAFAACDGPPADDGVAAVASEVRALRLQLQNAPASAPAFDAKALGEALAPLRDAVTALLQEQGALQSRQQALADELGRWAALAASPPSGDQRQQITALQTRLTDLEKTMRAQDTRHREVEAMVQKALDGTTTRLEAFLRALEQLHGAPAPGPGRSGNDGERTVPPGGDKAAGEHPEAPKEHGGEPRRSAMLSPLHRGWLFAVLACGLGALGVLAWRLFRAPALAGAAARHAGRPVVDAGAEEMWAAAQLLGEAVDDPRALPAAPAAPPAMPAPAAFTIEPPIGLAASLPSLRAEAPRNEPRREPPRRIVLLTVADRQRARVCAQATLATDPRVLRRPAPVFRDTAIGLEVEFALLPYLVPGEIEHVQALVRAAARST
jgi:hypothetical protein